MRPKLCLLSAALLTLLLFAACQLKSPPLPALKANIPSRSFRLTYAFTITGLAPRQEARVWIPVPSSTPEQTVTTENLPSIAQLTHDPDYHNTILYLAARADDRGCIPVSASYIIHRFQVTSATPAPANLPTASTLFLSANRLVPVGGKSSQLLASHDVPHDPLASARFFYDLVDDTMTYRKDKPGWGRGDSDWACDSHFGNCTDFHSLFISLARAHHLPARFDIGFMLPATRATANAALLAGYHCWAFVAPQSGRWLPVDIADANQHPERRDRNFGTLTPDRVTLSTGRDITLVPSATTGPLNFFVYPHVEVRGQNYDRFETRFTFQDLPE
jgi:transglutaminase-like putative cysteine protease